MNTDIRLKTSFRDHRKRKKLQLKLGAEGVLAFIDLMLMAAETRPDGILKGMDAEDIALDANWGGDAVVLVEILVSVGLLDKLGDGTLCIHDWQDHNAYAAAAEERSASARKAALARWGKRSEDKSNAESMPPACAPHESALPTAKNSNAPSPSPSPSPNPFPSRTQDARACVDPSAECEEEFSSSPPLPHARDAPPEDLTFSIEFLQFWDAYPRKARQKAAWEEWLTLKKARELPGLMRLLAAIDAQRDQETWQEERFIPHPAKWLHDYGWNDKPVEAEGPDDWKKYIPGREQTA